MGRLPSHANKVPSLLGSFSNTYNIYFGNQALLPTVRAAPADYPTGPVWVLDEGHEDVMIDHVHDFVVKFMMSDTVVCRVLSHTPHLAQIFILLAGFSG
jgi:hypothetical protein